MNKIFICYILCIFCIHFSACSGKKIDENNPQELLNDAEEDIKDHHYPIALDKLKNIKNKFPYSHLAVDAHLKIADIQFLDESYIEAASTYENFRDLHPKHAKADYVLFRIGESYFLQLPSTVERDVAIASKAISAYEELLELYPHSTYISSAQEHAKQSKEILADKEQYIADFYYSHGMYDSAAKRYEKITKQFIDSNAEQYAYWKWGQSLIKQSSSEEPADSKELLLSEAKHVYRTYLSRYPNGQFSQKVGNWLDQTKGR